MVKKSDKKLIYYLSVIFLFTLSDCANQLPPGGGEVDKIPPKIVDVYPVESTVNFDDDYFEVGFSEYVDKRSVKDAVFISPAIDGQLEFNWSGKYVRVYFPDSLKRNITYVVTIGTDVVDLNNRNRMAEAFTLTFATGIKIDKGSITGKIFNPKPDGVLIFAYKLDGDTINPSVKKPDYISQTGRDGAFKLSALADGKYRVFAILDEYRDLLYQAGQDKFGVPYKDFTIDGTDTLVEHLNFFLSQADTTKPRLLSSIMTDRNHILINFNEVIDSTIIKTSNFQIYDSTSNKKVKPVFAYKGNTKKTEMVLAINDSLSNENNVYLFVDTIKDKYGNIYTNDFTQITVSGKKDTTFNFLKSSFPSNGSRAADFKGQHFDFYFEDGFDTARAKSGIIFSDTSGRKINYKISFMDDASFEIIPSRDLSPEKDYLVKFDLSKFTDAAGNTIDSIYQYKFKTISGLDFTGVTGKIYEATVSQNPVIVLQNTKGGKFIYKQKLNNNTFNFERVEPGKYMLWCYFDIDSSGTYNYGKLFPFQPAEEFSVYKDTLNLRPRWVQTDLKFNFK